MVINRRQFLIAGGLAVGSGATGLARWVQSQPDPNPTVSSTLMPPPAAASPPKVSVRPNAPAPAGFAAPAKGDVRLMVISDLNSSFGSTDYLPVVTDAIAKIPDWQPDLVICGGDMIAGQKREHSRAQIDAMWAGFDRYIYQPLRQADLPFAFTFGNHDASSITQNGRFVFEGDRQGAAAYWARQNPGLNWIDRSGYPFYFSFEHQGIFYFSWDASSANVPPEQVAWAERALASNAAQQAKLRIALGHLSFYGIAQGRDRPGEILNRSTELQALLRRYQVHTYISGHQHAYFPAVSGNLQLLHCGALGSGPRTWIGSEARPIHTLTVVDIDLTAGATTYTTYNMISRQVIAPAELPQRLSGPTGTVGRYDLVRSL